MKTKAKSKSKHVVWNKDVVVGQKLSLTLRQTRAIRDRLKSAGKMRDLVLFSLAIESSLSGCDLVQLRVRDVVKPNKPGAKITVVQQKTQYPIQFEIHEETHESIAALVEQEALKPGDYLFPSRLHESPHISVRQYARAVASWMSLIGLDSTLYGTQSLRRTKPMLVYSQTKSVEAVQQLMGHVQRRNTTRLLAL